MPKYIWPAIVTALIGAVIFVWYQDYTNGKYKRVTLAGRTAGQGPNVPTN